MQNAAGPKTVAPETCGYSRKRGWNLRSAPYLPYLLLKLLSQKNSPPNTFNRSAKGNLLRSNSCVLNSTTHTTFYQQHLKA